MIAGLKRRSTLFPGEQVVARTRTAICIAFRVGCVTTAPMQRSRQNPEIDNSAFSNALRQGALRIDPIDAVGMRVRACIHVLYCTVLYCTVLYCAILYCTVLYCTVLYCTVLYIPDSCPRSSNLTISDRAPAWSAQKRYASGAAPATSFFVGHGLPHATAAAAAA